jgi:virulence-associated protein VagC
MHTKTISISGTYLVPIDPALLKQCPLGDEVDVSAERDRLVIRPIRHKARQGWAESLAALPAGVVDRDTAELTTFRETPHDWDRQKWEW